MPQRVVGTAQPPRAMGTALSSGSAGTPLSDVGFVWCRVGSGVGFDDPCGSLPT